ncbi:hypothetical protein HDIA_1120 [Hartmannibacter diazotrophicus]|uniref:DUF983 domain-containing protein n=1 Tax=Hartmannibacter diazotrophicus TaxID=1482074 RepID=A0A2C9D4G3_9HYPH|nr:DUF983 domain-containing protein [Hartmannibacter diazotrophicus]SON54661.1 hypothetical protein HDIA_1120 [Hartmannibacter diazotrophicus]
MDEHSRFAPVPPVGAGLRGRCPRCGNGRLFDGFLTTAPSCKSCGLDFKFIDSGDGPAVFVILIVGFIVVGLALWVEVAYQPPIWLHMLLWLPLTVILALGMLRPLKGLMIAMQYKHRAEEGRLVTPPPGEDGKA